MRNFAPTEKHLEQWIEDHFQRFGELGELDLLPEYANEGYYIQDENHYVSPFFAAIVERQPQFINGIPDYIMRTETSVSVVELKKSEITFEVVGQCLRYMHDLREMFYWTFFDARALENPDRESYTYHPTHNLEYTEYPNTEITGMVVGSHYSDKYIPLIAAACNIAVVTYDFDGNDYLFERRMIETKSRSVIDYQNYVETPIGRAIRLTMQNRKARQEIRSKNNG